jgi:ABC-type polar amino acid transport system ATPase subunit
MEQKKKEPRVGKPVEQKPLGKKIKTKEIIVIYGAKRAGKSTMSKEVVEALKGKGLDAYSVHGDLYVKDPLKHQAWRDSGEIAVFENHSWTKMKRVFPDLDTMENTYYLQITDEEFLKRAKPTMTARAKKTDEQLLKNKALKDRKGPSRCKHVISTTKELVKSFLQNNHPNL